MIRTVISDMGNVILPFDVTAFLERISEYSSMNKEDVMKIPVLHDGLINSFCKGLISPQEYYHNMKKIFKADIDFKKFKRIYCDIFSLNSSVLHTLSKLKGEKKLILLSNTDTLHFNFIKKRYPEIFIFDDYVLSYQTGSVKPEHHIFEQALKLAGDKPESAVFIDDMEENIQAAEELGLKTVHFVSGKDLEAELKKWGLSF
ncbi:MAG: HAD-IA family hydrolase [Candidatus Aminicenantes bacterium]|nr:HAD-IA family hydrolase [Candidatus Aminicenantes bacterium]